MKKFTRRALILMGAICALMVVALLAVNLYVQSKGTQARIEEELSQRLGATLRIQRISVTPWWGLKLTGITMPQADESLASDFLRADTFRLRVRLGSLFSRRLVIKEISLIGPSVVWVQNADGKWRLPMTFVEEPQPTNAAAAAAPPSTAGEETAGPVSAPSPPAVEPAQSAAFKPEVRRVTLTNGKFRFLDHAGKPVAIFEGVRFRSNVRSATEVRGDASIASTSLRDRFFLETLRSPVSYDPSALKFSDITAEAAGGTIHGGFTMRPADENSPFTATVDFENLDADRLLSQAHGPVGMVRGKLEGHLDAVGQTADPNALNGSGEIHLRDGQVRRYSLLVALGQLLQIEELVQLQLDEARVKFHITPGVVTIDELLFTSPNIRLSATGTISFEGNLALESRLAIHEHVRERLFSMVRDNFQPTDDPAYAAVSFQVSGTVEHPRTNLMDKVVGQDLRDLGNVINSFFGRGRSDRAKRKKAQELVAPSTSPTPVQGGAVPALEDHSLGEALPTPPPAPAPSATP